ncbi:CrpP-related protein [Achromobacter sp. ES-001]|jgi:hypothetical protein|uniref:CrpP-related protein n=1 Tax=Achromobacter sp. ES-001 TaxID=2860286 RepID=UPI0027148740|nr:CrpP-related protein [Achromobacter sp. ES-001]
MHCDHIQKLGAKAAREGLTLWDCPYLRAAEMPGHTGERISDWVLKIEAWEAGFRKHVRARSPTVRSRVRALVAANRSSAVVLRTG